VRLSEITSYACYCGRDCLARLAAYELAIVQAMAYAPQEIAWLEARKTQTPAYLSVGEVPVADAHPSWAIPDPATGAPLRNDAWDTLLVDCRSRAWQQHLLGVAIPGLLARGVAGPLLDTVDVQDRVPETRPRSG
jgi:hypothetical protein